MTSVNQAAPKFTISMSFALECECGNIQYFQGETVEDVLRKIDDSGWEHLPGGKGTCPECLERRDESELGWE